MQRRTFLQLSTLSASGMLAVSDVFAKSRGSQGEYKTPFGTSPAIALLCPPGCTEESVDYEPVAGGIRLLQETGYSFEVITPSNDFPRYQLVILPDRLALTDVLKEKMEAFLAQGGAVLASYRSGLTPDGTAFASASFGLTLTGHSAPLPSFLTTPSGPLGQAIASPELVMYYRGLDVKLNGATLLGQTRPPQGLSEAPSPAITRRGRVIYFAHPVFTQYAQSGPRWTRQLVVNAIAELLPKA